VFWSVRMDIWHGKTRVERERGEGSTPIFGSKFGARDGGFPPVFHPDFGCLDRFVTDSGSVDAVAATIPRMGVRVVFGHRFPSLLVVRVLTSGEGVCGA
jgi:hypothetical protein